VILLVRIALAIVKTPGNEPQRGHSHIDYAADMRRGAEPSGPYWQSLYVCPQCGNADPLRLSARFAWN
jgi:hypothetical protein